MVMESTTTTTVDKSMEDATAAMDISSSCGTTTATNDENANYNNHSNNQAAQTPVNNDEDKDINDDDDDATDAMDEDDDDDAEEEEDDNDDDKKETNDTSEGADEAHVCRALGLKEEGNKYVQANDYNQAARSYRRGITALKKVKNQLDDQVKQLKITLYTNWSTVTYKDQKYRVSMDMATKAVELDPSNVKALYRRAIAYRKLGNIDLARNDLRTAIAIEPNNTICRKELVSVKKEMEDTIAKQKKSFAKAFDSSKANSFLYDDKEELAKQRALEEERKKIEEEEKKQQRKKQWEDECVSLLAKNETVLSFEEWDKQRQEKEDKEKKEKDERRKAERKAKKASSSKKVNKATDDDDDDDVVFTEAELAAMRGYKKTSDGRTTSYFTREISQEAKMQIGDIAPKRLDTNGSSATNAAIPALQKSSSLSDSPSSLSSPSLSNSAVAAQASVWNQAGTWEEKNTTEWCLSQLKQRLLETFTADTRLSAQITKIDDITGDASVVVVSSKKRYIFDFHVKCKYHIYDNSIPAGEDGKRTSIASGTIRLPDICSTIPHEETEIICESYKKSPPSQLQDHTNTIRNNLVNHIRMQINLFVQDFNSMY